MKIYLIRHGQTTGDVEKRYGGAYDDELSDKGKIQVHELANKLGNSGMQILLCSPMIRAQQTAKILVSILPCEINTIEDLKERNKNGVLTGMTQDEAQKKYPKLVEEIKDYRNQIRGAESQEDFEKRIKKVITDVTNDINYSTIGIVTHGGPMWVVLKDILNLGITDIADCAYAVIDTDGQKLSLERLEGIRYKMD
jgi:broad specificity phosphatase PhoE